MVSLLLILQDWQVDSNLLVLNTLSKNAMLSQLDYIIVTMHNFYRSTAIHFI
jgi:hypothetical protein